MNCIVKSSCSAIRTIGIRCMSSNDGGKAGAIREAGGTFGKIEAAREEEYFLREKTKQLQALKDNKLSQADFHAQQIKEHKEAIKRHEESLKKVQK